MNAFSRHETRAAKSSSRCWGVGHGCFPFWGRELGIFAEREEAAWKASDYDMGYRTTSDLIFTVKPKESLNFSELVVLSDEGSLSVRCAVNKQAFELW